MQNKSQLNFDDLKNAIKNFDDCGSLFNLKINCVIIFRLFFTGQARKKRKTKWTSLSNTRSSLTPTICPKASPHPLCQLIFKGKNNLNTSR